MLNLLSWQGRTALITLIAAVFSAGPLSATPDGSAVVAKVGEESITFGQLSSAYSKNLKPDAKKLEELSMDSVVGFLKLYSRYRLKVQEAIARNYHKEETVRAEISDNQRRLTESHLFNSFLVDPMVEKIAERRRSEFRMAFVLVSKDTSLNKNPKAEAEEALAKIKKGDKFEFVAAEYSDDPNTAKEGGLLNVFITSGRVQPELEDAIYSLKEGEVYPELIETDMGYFILKLVDMEPRTAVETAHILIDVSQVNEGDWDVKKVTADSLYNLIKNGADFAALAREHSGDPGSAQNGGVLEGLYVRSGGFLEKGGKLVEEYEEALYDLKDGEISEPVKTQYGYHIIKRIRSQEVDGEEERKEIRAVYKRTAFENHKKTLLDSLYLANGLSINENTLQSFLSSVDQGKNNYDTTWAEGLSPALQQKVLFKYAGKDYTVAEYIEAMNTRQELRGISNKELSIRNAIEKIVHPVLLDDMHERFYSEDVEYKNLADEFRDGILLYKVESDEVWNKMKFDTVLAREYFKESGLKFMTDTIVDFTEIYLIDEDMANNMISRIEQGEKISQLAAEHTERAKYRETNGKWVDQQVSKNKLLRLTDRTGLKVGQLLGPIKVDMGYSIIQIDKITPPRVKTFEESIPDFASQYQDYRHKQLSSQWINQLESSYDVEIYEDMIKDILDK